MSDTIEEESLFSELGKFEELQSPFHLFPVLHRELESLNRLKRNREKSVLVSSVLSGLHLGNDSQNQEETLDLSGTLSQVWLDEYKEIYYAASPSVKRIQCV